MSVTQDYKNGQSVGPRKPHACCNFNCKQGRNCPFQPPCKSFGESIVCMCAAALLLATPLLFWYWNV